MGSDLICCLKLIKFFGVACPWIYLCAGGCAGVYARMFEHVRLDGRGCGHGRVRGGLRATCVGACACVMRILSKKKKKET